MVTEVTFSRKPANAILSGVKDLKAEWPRVYFRLPPPAVRPFREASAHYGGYQNVLERFGQYFVSLTPEQRDELMRRMPLPSIPEIAGKIISLPNVRTVEAARSDGSTIGKRTPKKK
jgi:hypothetical protein